MTQPDAARETAAWVFQVWASFLLAAGATAIGIGYLPVDPWVRGYLVMGFLFTVGSAFSLAKTLRDQHEAGKLLSRITNAKAERLIREYETEPAQ